MCPGHVVLNTEVQVPLAWQDGPWDAVGSAMLPNSLDFTVRETWTEIPAWASGRQGGPGW